MIYAEQLSYGFPQKELYNKISFSLEEGRHCALIGSNGVGKSTLIDIIRKPENFLFDGKLHLEHVGRIGFVSQFAHRDPQQEQTVFDCLAQDFLALQEEISGLCVEMETAEELEPLLERYQALLDESESMDADNYEVNIRRELRLSGLAEKEELPLIALSGGEYKLVQIIREILRRPGLLIMDEPDVFLDFENLAGLRDLINHYDGTMLVVTHNRYLLGHCFNQIWHLENGDLQQFEGSFHQYNAALLLHKVEEQEEADKHSAEIQRVSEMVERLRDEATEVVDPLRGRTLKGKVSYLGRLMAKQIKAPFLNLRHPRISFPSVERPAEETVLLQVTDYAVSFEEKLLEHVTFAVRTGEKVALVGPNGTGKTTLLRAIRENADKAISFADGAVVGFFSQLQEEALCSGNTIMQEFLDLGFESREAVEEHLEQYCFNPDGLHRNVAQLSGGEKNLLQLAKLSVSNANFLLLDEPSSHLDTYAQIELEKAIRAYQGAVVMVSHDFYSIVNCADTILFVEDGTVRPVSNRAFRKRIYKNHFSREYLELDLKRQELETKIQRCLGAKDHETARILSQELERVVSEM